MPPGFVIFIYTFDAFGKEQWKYTFQNMCREDFKLTLNDDTTKIFFNTKGIKGKISKEAKRILEFIESNAAEDDFTKRLAAEVQKIKENKEWKVEYMTLLMKEREKYKEGYAKGEADGEARGEARGIIDTLLELGYTYGDILSILQKKLNITAIQAEDYFKRFKKETL